MRQNPHVRICGGPGSATTLVYPTSDGGQDRDRTLAATLQRRTSSHESRRPVGGEFVGIRHRSIFGSREPGVPREVVAMA